MTGGAGSLLDRVCAQSGGIAVAVLSDKVSA
jgi:hypothetical protein